MQRRFVTIFPVTENVHLIKDVGQIPYNLYKHYGYDSTIVCYKNSDAYPNLDGEVSGLKIDFLSDQGRKLFQERAVLNYLKAHAKEIDVLNLYHLTKETIYYGLYYKKLNPQGVLYVKMDVYNEMLEQGIVYSKKWWKNAIHKAAERKFMRKVDLMSCENPISLGLLQNMFPTAKQKFFLVPNGVNDEFVDTHFESTKSFAEKENILLTVGRIGSKEKNHEMLFEAISKVDLKDWKVIFAGPVEEDFKEFVNEMFQAHPQLEYPVEFAGEFTDRKALFELYDRAKVFCLTSPFESFGIAFVEAQFFGNYLLGTKGHSSFDLISDGLKLGQQVENNDSEALAKLIQQIIDGQLCDDETTLQSKTYAREQFSWSKVTKAIDEQIDACLAKK